MHDKQRKNPNLIRRAARPIAAFGVALVSIVSVDIGIAHPTSPSTHNTNADRKHKDPVRDSQLETARTHFALFTGGSAIKLLAETDQPRKHHTPLRPSPRIDVMQSIAHRAYESSSTNAVTTTTSVRPITTTTTSVPEQAPTRKAHIRLSPHEVMSGNNVRFVFDSIMAHGYSATIAAGITGNLMYESDGDGGNINPTQEENGRGGGYGMAQFTGVELSRMKSWTTNNNLDPASIEGQTQYLMYDLDANYPTVVTALKATTTVAEATEVFEIQYEQPRGSNTVPISSGAAATLPGRIQNAQNVYAEYGDN